MIRTNDIFATTTSTGDGQMCNRTKCYVHFIPVAHQVAQDHFKDHERYKPPVTKTIFTGGILGAIPEIIQ